MTAFDNATNKAVDAADKAVNATDKTISRLDGFSESDHPRDKDGKFGSGGGGEGGTSEKPGSDKKKRIAELNRRYLGVGKPLTKKEEKEFHKLLTEDNDLYTRKVMMKEATSRRRERHGY